MRFALIVGVAAVMGVGGCHDRHRAKDLVLASSSMSTDSEGVTWIDGEVVNQTDKDMSFAIVSFGIYASDDKIGDAGSTTNHIPARGTWTFHANGGKLYTSPGWYQLLNLQGY